MISNNSVPPTYVDLPRLWRLIIYHKPVTAGPEGQATRHAWVTCFDSNAEVVHVRVLKLEVSKPNCVFVADLD